MQGHEGEEVQKTHAVPEILVVETWYNNRLYRSRTEARWAVFLETLGEPFVYEPECYILPPVAPSEDHYVRSAVDEDMDVLYLPDFWLPRVKQYVEIKPYSETWGYDAITTEKALRLTYHTDNAVIIVSGQPGFVDGSHGTPFYRAWPYGDEGYLWCECHACGAVGLQFNGRSDRLACKRERYGDKSLYGCPRLDGEHSDDGLNYNTPRLRHAFDVARNYRFDWKHNGLRGR